jgi:CDP-archaeol synthase
MDLGLIARVLVLLMVANGAPVVVKSIFVGAAARPLDFERRLGDGRPLLGKSKTIRGVIAAILCAAGVAPLLGLDWRVGALTATGAMAGDLLSSFTKRRLGMQPSTRALGLDQIPESFFGALAAGAVLQYDIADFIIINVAFFCGQLALSRGAYAIGLRDEPH